MRQNMGSKNDNEIKCHGLNCWLKICIANQKVLYIQTFNINLCKEILFITLQKYIQNQNFESWNFNVLKQFLYCKNFMDIDNSTYKNNKEFLE